MKRRIPSLTSVLGRLLLLVLILQPLHPSLLLGSSGICFKPDTVSALTEAEADELQADVGSLRSSSCFWVVGYCC